MKKLKLNFQHLGTAEVLTRSQLKKVIGGTWGSGGGSGGSVTHGECSAPDVGAWTYSSPVEFSVCRDDVWTYCRGQRGKCY